MLGVLISSLFIAGVWCALEPTEKALMVRICADTNIGTFKATPSLKDWCNFSVPECQWFGMSCINFVGFDRITELRIEPAHGQHVVGQLPPKFQPLAFLQVLILRNMAATATLGSQFLSTNAALNTVILSDFPISGNFSFDHLPGSVQLVLITRTKIGGTLAGDPSRLADLTSLVLISLQLQGSLPPALFELLSLRAVQIENTLVSGDIPVEICRPGVQFILNDNRLTNRPTCLIQIGGFCSMLNNLFCTGKNNDDGECAVDVTPKGVTDQCLVCAGDGTSCTDCNGVPFGTSVRDVCGFCDGSITSINDCPPDCTGTPLGLAVYDVCDVCQGGGTTCRDCAGVANGPAVYDVCDVCDGDGLSCVDCKGVLGGTSRIDACDVCQGDESTCKDCAGIPNGPSLYDDCDVCNGSNASCGDCAGTPYGTSVYDRCDICGGDDTQCGLGLLVENTQGSTTVLFAVIVAVMIALTLLFLCLVCRRRRPRRPATV